ncbi:MAG: DUF3458 domain-containing protein, partial [Pseudomonadota bacterium]
FNMMANMAPKRLEGFFNWYLQAGTPRLTARCIISKPLKQFTIKLTVKDTNHANLVIPIACQLLKKDGQICTKKPIKGDYIVTDKNELILLWSNEKSSFVFNDMGEAPVAILNRRFSAPIEIDQTPLVNPIFILKHEKDPFTLWDHCQATLNRWIKKQIRMVEKQAINQPVYDRRITDLVDSIFDAALGHTKAPSLSAKLLQWPTLTGFLDQNKIGTIELIDQSINILWRISAMRHQNNILKHYEELNKPVQQTTLGERALRNSLIAFIAHIPDALDILLKTYDESDSMGLRLQALRALANMPNNLAPIGEPNLNAQAQKRFDHFYQQYKNDDLVIDHWFRLQATSPLSGHVANIKTLSRDPVFSLLKPNKVRALLGAFAFSNPIRFHSKDGSGYHFIQTELLMLDQKNPQIAARLASCFSNWQYMDPKRKKNMQKTLQNLSQCAKLSPNLDEMIERILHPSK